MSLAYPYGTPRASGLLRCHAEDFIVDEELGFEPSGEGEHLFVQIEKRGLSTPELIASIARCCALHPRHIGHSGLKDKHALSRQWLSLHLPGRPDPAGLADGEDYRILRCARHRSKLRPGTHEGNRFELCLRQVSSFSTQSREQISRVIEHGFANYFGRQRFGRQGDNVERALLQLGRKKIPRQRRSLLISALRSHLFNQILTRRIGAYDWTRPVEGDVFMLNGSHSLFSEDLDAVLLQRYASLDIHATASLYGAGKNLLRQNALALEQRVCDDNPEITDCLDRVGVKRQMRAVRAQAGSFEYDYNETNQTLQMRVRLVAGSYVTSLLEHFIVTRDAN